MSLPKPREERTAAGVLTMFFAVVFFTCIDSSAKWLTLAGLPVMQVVFARYCGHFVYAALVYMPQEGLSAFRSRAPLKQVLRSSFLFGSTVCNFFALQSLPITVTTTITFAGPIVVTLLAIPILGEKVGLRRIAAVCTGFVGVLVVMQPWGAEFHPAMLFSLAALAIASLYFIMTRMLAGVETIATQQPWSSGIASVVLAPFAVSVWVWPEGRAEWLVMCLIGGFGMASFFVFLASAPFVYVEQFGLSPTGFSVAFALNAIGFFTASQLASWLGAKMGMRRLIRRGVTGFTLFTLALVVVGLTVGTTLPLVVAGLFCANACLGVVIPTSMVLALARNLPIHQTDFQAGRWRKRSGHLLSEWTIGLVGLGRIGRRVAELLTPFGPKLLASDPNPDLNKVPQAVSLCGLPELLPQADLVSVHLSRSPNEGPLIRRKELFAMKPGSRPSRDIASTMRVSP